MCRVQYVVENIQALNANTLLLTYSPHLLNMWIALNQHSSVCVATRDDFHLSTDFDVQLVFRSPRRI
jgi:hypothetical protein